MELTVTGTSWRLQQDLARAGLVLAGRAAMSAPGQDRHMSELISAAQALPQGTRQRAADATVPRGCHCQPRASARLLLSSAHSPQPFLQSC